MGEALSETDSDENSDGSEDSTIVTSRELRRLQETPEFLGWCRWRGIGTRELERNARSLALFRKLRRVHPESFWALVKKPVWTSETVQVETKEAVVQYLFSILLMLAAMSPCLLSLESFGIFSISSGLMRFLIAAIGLVCCLVVMWQWFVQQRPFLGHAFSMWYVVVEQKAFDDRPPSTARLQNSQDMDLTYGTHLAPAWRIAFAACIEAIYVVGSLGLGIPISLFLRIFGSVWTRGSVGERFVGIVPVKERMLRVA